MGLAEKQLFNQEVVQGFATSAALATVEHGWPVSGRQSQRNVLGNAPNQSLEAALSSIFPDQQEETQLQKARRIMGSEIDTLSDEDVRICITEFQQILSSLFDQFEKNIFDNNTLQQLLREE